MGLDDSISAAVDTISGSASPASPPDTAPATSSASADPAPSGKTPDAPAAPGKGAAPKPSAKATGGPTRQAAPDSAPQDDSIFTREKHEQGLANRAKKERETVFTELATELGLDLRDPNIRANLRAFQQNPSGYVRANAQHWGLTLAEQAAQAAQQQPQGEPQPDLVAEDGVTLAYSAPQMAAWWQWQRNALTQELNARFGPVEGVTRTIQQTIAWNQALTQASADIKEAETWPRFTELRQEVHDIMKEDGRATLSSAYARALKNNDSKFRDQDRNALLTELKSRPAVVDTAPVRAVARANGRSKRSGLDQAINDAIDQAAAAAR